MRLLYRVVFDDGDCKGLFFSLADRGRFHTENRPGRRPSYAATDPRTAWLEVQKYSAEADPAKFAVLVIECDVEDLDLTEPAVQAREGVDSELLTGPHEPCQELARRLRERKIGAIITYSAANRPEGRCVVVFEECLKSKRQFRVRQVLPLAAFLEAEGTNSSGSAKSAKHRASRKKN